MNINQNNSKIIGPGHITVKQKLTVKDGSITSRTIFSLDKKLQLKDFQKSNVLIVINTNFS